VLARRQAAKGLPADHERLKELLETSVAPASAATGRAGSAGAGS
jgi:hypothetical protein